MRFFFNRSDGLVDRDVQGLEMPTLGDACQEAIIYMGEILKFNPHMMRVGEEFRIEVEDARGRVLFRLRVTAEGIQNH